METQKRHIEHLRKTSRLPGMNELYKKYNSMYHEEKGVNPTNSHEDIVAHAKAYVFFLQERLQLIENPHSTLMNMSGDKLEKQKENAEKELEEAVDELDDLISMFSLKARVNHPGGGGGGGGSTRKNRKTRKQKKQRKQRKGTRRSSS